ncbi:hypothetical protein D3C75_668570 [compost metagenome]
MKRLKKKASVESDFLIQWIDDWESISNYEVDKIISDNQDCSYSGEAYRVLFLRNYPIGRDIKEWNNLVADKKAVDESIKGNIRNENFYVSFSQTIDGSMFFANNNAFDGETAWLIKSNVSGLDLSKLYLKFQSELNGRQFAYDGYQEVIAKLNSYEIIGCIINNQLYQNYSVIEKRDENNKWDDYVINVN